MNALESLVPMTTPVPQVKCDSCCKIMPMDSKKFITVYGNICIGINGGIISNNLVLPNDKLVNDSDIKLKSASVFCNTCFRLIVDDMFTQITLIPYPRYGDKDAKEVQF